jgi:hypothetical protein
MQTMTTLQDFIAQHGITATAKWADRNPNMADDAWARTATHWRVVLRKDGRQLTIPFSQGSAHTKPPTAADVLDAIASDIAGVRNAQDLADYMAEYGMDDHNEARRMWQIVERQDEKLQRFLADDDAVETLLWNTERL